MPHQTCQGKGLWYSGNEMQLSLTLLMVVHNPKHWKQLCHPAEEQPALVLIPLPLGRYGPAVFNEHINAEIGFDVNAYWLSDKSKTIRSWIPEDSGLHS